MARKKENIQRVPGTTRVEYDLVIEDQPITVKLINQQIAAINAQIAELEAQVAQLQADRTAVQAVEPKNADAVDYAITEIDNGTEVSVIEAALQLPPWSLEPADAADVILDAQEIIAERV